MCFDATLKTHLSLSQDDIDGISYLYPRNETGRDKPLGCAMVANPKPPSPGSFAILVLVFLLPLALWASLSRSLKIRALTK
jgi:hypothetical protein